MLKGIQNCLRIIIEILREKALSTAAVAAVEHNKIFYVYIIIGWYMAYT